MQNRKWSPNRYWKVRCRKTLIAGVLSGGTGIILLWGCSPRHGSAEYDQAALYESLPRETKPIQPVSDSEPAEIEMETLIAKTAVGSTLDELQAWANTILTNTIPDSMEGGKLIYPEPDFLKQFDSQRVPFTLVFWDKNGTEVYVEVKWASLPAGQRYPVFWGFFLGKQDLAPPSLHMFRTTLRRLRPGVFAYALTVKE